MDNRYLLNLGNNDRNYPPNERAYPTTPSTFPQPVFQGQSSQEGYGQQGANGFGGGGYFMNNPYPPQYQQQQQQQPQQQQQQAPQHSLQVPQNSFQQRQQGYNPVEGANGLAHQFSHQNLGTQPRQAAGFARQPSPSSRPKTAGASDNAQTSSLLSPNAPSFSSQLVEEPKRVERNPDLYTQGTSAQNAKLCRTVISNFFQTSVERARDRNGRAQELNNYLNDPAVSNNRKEQKKIREYQKEAEFLRFLRTKERPQNFQTLKVIGKGAFGEVKLVQKKADGKIYALKSLVKAEMFKKDQLAHVRAERDILAESDSPWVVKLFTTFQDASYLYMLMEFLPGGDLMTMLIKYEIFSEDITRFYMAEIILAIEVVHKLGFIHRDIKPDNIILDKGGHIKLTDFGLSTGFHKQHDNSYYQQLLTGKSNKPRDRSSVSLDQINLTVSNRGQINTWRKSRRVMAYSTVGTPDYIAPEIFSGQGYSFECDWWSLGTIMFECLIGWPPFCAEDPHDTYRKIVNWRETLFFPDDVELGAEAEHFIRSIICDPSSRLGRNGADEIKNHSFFRGVVWDQLRKIRAPFEPKLASNIDTTYFPTDEIDQNDHSTAVRAQVHNQSEETAAEMSLPFVGYTYKRYSSNA
ncbi:MAG: Serine/threonine-protein kinase [Sclerophora amabilis]|nr:MAG: Serine/threonine-protein kinase [Sclerophora amabilis]